MEGLDLNVSRETLERLQSFEVLVKKWTRKINLVSRQDVDNIWDRHILDSAQIFSLAPSTAKWVDIGSGGGFPGIVVSILSAEYAPAQETVLIESDQRKCAFLRTAFRELSLNGRVICDRIENVQPQNADVVSARALADLSQLLTHAERHLTPSGHGIFLKGKNWAMEHQIAQQQWSYVCEAITSKSDPAAAVLKIKELKRV